MNQIKYSNFPESKEFLQILKIRIADHFKDAGTTTYASKFMWAKIVLILSMWLISYICILSNYFHSFLLVLLILIHGLTHLLIPFNISHDANHGAISKNKRVNSLLSYTLTLIGLSDFFWRISHNKEHHSFINVKEIDTNTNGYGVLKFSPEENSKRQYKFQHLYVTFIYCFTTLNYIFMKEFKMIMSNEYKIPKAAIIELIIIKLFYFGYVFVLPYVLLDVPFINILITFILVHFMLGIMLTFVFQCGHFTEDAHYPTIKEGVIQDGWAIHTLRTTCDYATNNKLITSLTGSINIHIPHHLFPTICHIHYKSLAPIIRNTAIEYGLPYREYRTFGDAIISHLKLLKKLGESN